MKLTKAQQQAVQLQGSRMLVSAGAGSGKTRVLIERMVYVIEQIGLPSSRLLALTFTDQAARQMADRLEQRLGDHEATICTFHAFCGKILREYPPLAGVAPAFVLIDETKAQEELRALSQQLLFEPHLVSPGFGDWAGAYGWDAAAELLVVLYAWWRERPPSIEELGRLSEQAAGQVRSEQLRQFDEALARLRELYASGRIKAPGTLRRMEAIVACSEQGLAQGEQLFAQVSR